MPLTKIFKTKKYLPIILSVLCLPVFLLPWKQTGSVIQYFYNINGSPVFYLLIITIGLIAIINSCIQFLTDNLKKLRWKIILAEGIALLLAFSAFLLTNKEFPRLYSNLSDLNFLPIIALLPLVVITTLLYVNPFAMNAYHKPAYLAALLFLLSLYVFPFKKEVTFFPIIFLVKNSGSLLSIFLLLPPVLSSCGLFYILSKKREKKPAKFLVSTFFVYTAFLFWVIAINGECPLDEIAVMSYSLSILLILITALLSIMTGYCALHRKD